MERERPDYLEPIPNSRWEFPWLGLWAVLLLGLAGAGIWLHLKTGDAWNQRFVDHARPADSNAPDEPQQKHQNMATAEQMAVLETQVRHARQEAQRNEQELLRCINGMLFRKIPGGWENLPGQSCP